MKAVTCPQCQTPVPAADLNLTTGLAVCRPCDAAFEVGRRPSG